MKVIVDYIGRRIRLTDERLAHILRHPEMEGLEPLIEQALQQPGLVMASASDESVSLYYCLLPRTRVGVKWLCVPVKFLEDDAFILTAYLTDKPKKGNQTWPDK